MSRRHVSHTVSYAVKVNSFYFHFRKNQRLNFFLCSRHFTDDCFSNLGEFNAWFTKHLLLKDVSVPSLFGPAGSTQSQPVSMINNRCLYFLLSVQNRELWQWAYRFRHPVDQSQQTGPSDQSEQSRLTERRGLERTASNESFENHWKMWWY